MFPRALQACTVEGRALVPRYLTAEDHPWLRALLDVHADCVAKRRRDFHAEVARGLGVPAPPAKLRMAAYLLERRTTDRVAAPVPPRRIREAVFRHAAAQDRSLALTNASLELGVDAGDLEALLFADLPGERVVQPLAEQLGPAVLASQVNTALVASLLQRASQVRVTAHGNVRALVRHAKLVGLLCVCDLTGEELTMHLSGPCSLFRRTRMYGRALASLLPRLAWCCDFRLVASCPAEDPRGAALELVVTQGDPIEAGQELRRFDSTLEERFARDFGRLTSSWELVREPQALPTEHGLFFPDFALVHRRDPRRRWFVEIVGFWTEAYLRGKREALGAAGLGNVIVCVDETRACSLDGLPPGLLVVPYRRRVPARRVLELVEAAPPGQMRASGQPARCSSASMIIS